MARCTSILNLVTVRGPRTAVTILSATYAVPVSLFYLVGYEYRFYCTIVQRYRYYSIDLYTTAFYNFAVDEEIMGLPLPSTTKKQRTKFDQDDY